MDAILLVRQKRGERDNSFCKVLVFYVTLVRAWSASCQPLLSRLHFTSPVPLPLPAHEEVHEDGRTIETMPLAEGIVVRDSATGGGKQLVTAKPFPKGAMIWVADLENETQSQPRTWAEVEAMPADAKEAFLHFMYQTGPRTHSH